MSKIINYLNKNKVGQFTTIRDGEVIMRPFHFVMEKEGRFYFGTANDKQVYKELQVNPNAGFAVMGDSMQWLRLRGKVMFVDDQQIKEEMFEAEPLLASVYKTPDNERFEPFYIYDGAVSLHGGMGKTVEEMEF